MYFQLFWSVFFLIYGSKANDVTLNILNAQRGKFIPNINYLLLLTHYFTTPLIILRITIKLILSLWNTKIRRILIRERNWAFSISMFVLFSFRLCYFKFSILHLDISQFNFSYKRLYLYEEYNFLLLYLFFIQGREAVSACSLEKIKHQMVLNGTPSPNILSTRESVRPRISRKYLREKWRSVIYTIERICTPFKSSR